jgi:ketosteroid isomerase-like protein
MVTREPAEEAAVELVLAYIVASQRARSTGDAADFGSVRAFLADDIVIKLAGPWTEAPWRVAHEGPDAVIARLQDPVNSGPVLRTETVNAVSAGGDVLIEQVSVLRTESGERTSAVCFLFTVRDGKITACRTYRNDAGLPTPLPPATVRSPEGRSATPTTTATTGDGLR